MKSLGLDLGSNSLGWAIVDEGGQISDKGVLVFPEGIDAASDTLETPAAIRRAARMARRMKFRRKIRKWALLKILIENKMCPLSPDELADWKKNGTYPLKNKEFLNWLKSTDTSNPYADRALAAEQKVAPFTLGRALYHIAQRRGFKSSRKDASPDTGDDAADKKAADKKLGAVKSDINALTAAIEETGCKTLGQYFFKCLQDQKDRLAKDRIRKHYTGRIEHYEKEFAVIMETQKVPENLRGALYKAIFMQRPLRSQKNLVGNCPLEPNFPRCMIGHPLFEEYRARCFINNLTLEDLNGDNKTPLNDGQRDRVLACFMRATPTFKFGVIAKAFKKEYKEGLKFHYYRDDQSLSSCSTRARIQTAFGEVPFDEQMVFDALSFFDDDQKIHDWFKKHFPALDEKGVLKACAIHPKEGNAQYSLKAIRKILPWLRKGFDPSLARFLAKFPDVLPEFKEHEDEIILHLKELIAQYRKTRDELKDEKLRRTTNPVRLFDLFHDYLANEWSLTDEQWNELYLKSDTTYIAETEGRIPKVQLGMIRNPLVQRAMTTLRRLVNYLRDHGRIDADTVIRIELARDVNDFATRHAYQNWQKYREDQRAEARKELGLRVTEDAVDRWILWKEQGEKCLYTGKQISFEDILTGNKFDIEHTIPRSRSGDDSQANKTLCDVTYNRDIKKGHIPSECANYDDIRTRLQPWREERDRLEKDYQNQNHRARQATDPATRSAARIKALTTKFEFKYWDDKLRRFDVTTENLVDPADGLNGFKRRQLVDTGIMCSHAVELLRSVYPQVHSVNGAATAFARKAWGIQQEDKAKDRSEHTHHAKDAMVIAALTPMRFNAICAALKNDDGRRPCDICKPPFPHFADDVRKAIDEILVKHVLRQTTLRQSSKRNALAKGHWEGGKPNTRWIKTVLSRGDTVRGPLHKDTFYGCIHKPGETSATYVVRKPLIGPIGDVQVLIGKIIDPAIQSIVQVQCDKLAQQGVKVIEAGAFKMPSGVPINKVRIEAHTTNPTKLRDHAMPSKAAYKTPYYVVSAEGSNFRLALFNIDGKPSVEPDNSLDWAQNHKRPDYVPFHEKPGFIGYIMPGTMALTYQEGHPEEPQKLTTRGLEDRLYKVVKWSNVGQMTLRFHREARASTVLEKELVKLGKHAKGESKIDLQNPHEVLLVSPSTYLAQMLFEGIDFSMALNGNITFFNRKK